MRRAFAACCLLAGAGCGYTLGLDNFGPTGRTIAVGVVDNRTFRQKVDIPLTREIYVALAEHSNLRPATPDVADTLLDVEIIDIRGRNLVGKGNTPVAEGALDFAVHSVLRDGRSGAILREAHLVDRATFRIDVGETEGTATSEAVSQLARKIVLALEAEF